jgi:hypothetical protein
MIISRHTVVRKAEEGWMKEQQQSAVSDDDKNGQQVQRN